MFPGKLKYVVDHIKTSTNVHHCLSYDEVLYLIRKWGGGDLHSSKHILIQTNYPWVYKSPKEIIGDVNDYKLLVIPSISLFGRLTLSKMKYLILADKHAHYLELLAMVHDKIRFGEFNKLVAKDETEQIAQIYGELKAKYNITQRQIQARVDGNVHFIRNMCSTQMRSDAILLSLLQGRKSLIRNVIPKKVPSLRGQILLRPELKPNQIILPVVWAASVFGIAPSKLVDLTVSQPLGDEYFTRLKTMRAVFKRDPAINGASLSVHDSVAFANTDLVFVGMGELENKNADLDGDTETGTVPQDIMAVHELDLNMSAQYAMLLFNKPRITFTESQILYMHQRRFADTAFPYARLYKFLRCRETMAWLTDVHNFQMITGMARRYPQHRLATFVEPTREIMYKMLQYLPLLDSSAAAVGFYNFITLNCVRLANGDTNTPLYDPLLPADFFMKRDILCDSLIKICLSNAKGTIETLKLFAERLQEIDGTTKLTSEIVPLDRRAIISQSDSITQTMANKSRQVAINGHYFFKSNISYDTINFDQNKLNYNGITICDNLDFLDPCLRIPPDLAFLVTFVENYE